jgi:protein-tyrosine phosphatase
MAAMDTKLLKKLKIQAIVNLDGPEMNYTPAAGIIILHRYFPDGTAISHEILEEILHFIKDQISLERNVLVHCAMGMSRSPSIVIAWFMDRYPDLTWDQAFLEVSRKRQIWPAEEIKTSILAYFSQKRANKF